LDWRCSMKAESEELLREALELLPIERVALVDRLLTSLDKPDDAIDQAWRKEVAARLRASRSGTGQLCRRMTFSRDTEPNECCRSCGYAV
jgi:hypothetical protein